MTYLIIKKCNDAFDYFIGFNCADRKLHALKFAWTLNEHLLRKTDIISEHITNHTRSSGELVFYQDKFLLYGQRVRFRL